MIYNEYKIKYYKDSVTGKEPVREYIMKLDKKDIAKIAKYIGYLRDCGGYLDEPYSKHIVDKIRELRVDFSHNNHRIFYFSFVDKKIILLHAFLKKTDKTPEQEIKRAQNNYKDAINNYQLYD
jgi:phage-related protein